MLSGEEISHPSVYIVFLNGKLQHLSFWFLYYPEIASLFYKIEKMMLFVWWLLLPQNL